jgi:hypothetical protein
MCFADGAAYKQLRFDYCRVGMSTVMCQQGHRRAQLYTRPGTKREEATLDTSLARELLIRTQALHTI